MKKKRRAPATVGYPQLRDATTSEVTSSDTESLYKAFYEQALVSDDNFIMPGWDDDYQYTQNRK